MDSHLAAHPRRDSGAVDRLDRGPLRPARRDPVGPAPRQHRRHHRAARRPGGALRHPGLCHHHRAGLPRRAPDLDPDRGRRGVAGPRPGAAEHAEQRRRRHHARLDPADRGRRIHYRRRRRGHRRRDRPVRHPPALDQRPLRLHQQQQAMERCHHQPQPRATPPHRRGRHHSGYGEHRGPPVAPCSGWPGPTSACWPSRPRSSSSAASAPAP